MSVTVRTFSSLSEAERAIGSNRAARVLGGGTILMRQVNAGDQSLGILIRVTDPAMRAIRQEGGRIVIGAAVTMSQVAQSRDLEFLAPVARQVGGPQVRNMGTVGGNLFAPPPYGDFSTALMVLGAQVHFAGASGGTRGGMAIDEFMRDRDRHVGRLVQAVSVERPREADALRWLKVSRVKPKGVAVLSIAANVPRSGPRLVAYGNMGPAPLRATAVERALEGVELSAGGIQRALAAATDGLAPPTDALASEWYRREVAPVHLRRLLLREV